MLKWFASKKSTNATVVSNRIVSVPTSVEGWMYNYESHVSRFLGKYGIRADVIVLDKAIDNSAMFVVGKELAVGVGIDEDAVSQVNTDWILVLQRQYLIRYAKQNVAFFEGLPHETIIDLFLAHEAGHLTDTALHGQVVKRLELAHALTVTTDLVEVGRLISELSAIIIRGEEVAWRNGQRFVDPEHMLIYNKFNLKNIEDYQTLISRKDLDYKLSLVEGGESNKPVANGRKIDRR